MYMPHGAVMKYWTPATEGKDFVLPRSLEPLEPFKHHVTTFENLENTAAGGSVHTLNPATWLSCVRPDTAAKGASRIRPQANVKARAVTRRGRRSARR